MPSRLPRRFTSLLIVAAATMGTATAQQQAQPPTAWIKLCDPAPCRTLHEQHQHNGALLVRAEVLPAVAAAGRHDLKIEIARSQTYVVPAGMRAFVYDAQTWAKLQRKEKIDERTVSQVKLAFTACGRTACSAAGELPSGALTALRGAAKLLALAITASGKPIAFELPLDGFSAAQDGAPTERAVNDERRIRLVGKPPEPKPVAARAPQANKWMKRCQPFNQPVEQLLFNSDGMLMDGPQAGKDNRLLCLTHREESKAGLALGSAAIQVVQGANVPVILVNLPPTGLDIDVTAGVRVGVYSKEQWAKAGRNPQTAAIATATRDLRFTLCHPNGCTAEANAESILQAMTSGEMLLISATSTAGPAISIEMPLAGFKTSFNGPAGR